MGAPVVSVVVPARNSAELIGRALAAIPRETATGAVELIVVDDASDDDTGAVAERAGARVVRLEAQGGPAGARNAGLAAASAPLVAFTDADCVPAAGWLDAILAAFEGADLVQGPVLPDPATPVGPFDRTLHLAGASPRFETANLAVRRETAAAVGGFEPFVPVPGEPERGLRPRPDQGHFGEDVVFGWRARRLGARVAFAEGAVVHHAVFPRDARGYVAERWRLRYFPALVREVPELRETLPRRYFLSERTRRFDLALAGVALAARRRSVLPLALAAPYVARELRTWAPFTRAGIRENAARVAADAVGLAGLLRGSAAARRLLL